MPCQSRGSFWKQPLRIDFILDKDKNSVHHILPYPSVNVIYYIYSVDQLNSVIFINFHQILYKTYMNTITNIKNKISNKKWKRVHDIENSTT